MKFLLAMLVTAILLCMFVAFILLVATYPMILIGLLGLTMFLLLSGIVYEAMFS